MSEDKLQFLYYFTPGKRAALIAGPEAWTDADNAVAEAHYLRLKQAAEDGILILAGRSQDWVGPAVVIIEVESEEAAREFMEADPFVKEGLFGASLHPFKAALMRRQE
ncbi:MAG: YciI family protein [Chloroflexota bacterium]